MWPTLTRSIALAQHRPPSTLQVYYVFGFLFLVLLILFVTCAEISVVMCYFQLCRCVSSQQQQRWQWIVSTSSRCFFLECASASLAALFR